MVPFLVESSEDLIITLCSKFIKRKVLGSTRTTYSLFKLDLTDNNKQKSISEADLDFAINHDLKFLLTKKPVANCCKISKGSYSIFSESVHPYNGEKLNEFVVCSLFALPISKLNGRLS